jgi:hypothetical protein
MEAMVVLFDHQEVSKFALPVLAPEYAFGKPEVRGDNKRFYLGIDPLWPAYGMIVNPWTSCIRPQRIGHRISQLRVIFSPR